MSNNNLLELGALTASTGVITTAFVSTLAIPILVPASLISLGVGAIAMHFTDNNINWDKFFKSVELKNKLDQYPLFQESKETKNGLIYRFALPLGINVNDFIKQKDNIEAMLNNKVNITYNNKCIFIEIVSVALKDKYDFEIINNKKINLGYALGEDLVSIDLDSTECHTLISGITGSGKSVCLNTIITQLSLQNKELWLSDLKGGVELKKFAKLNNCKYFCKSEEETTEMLFKIQEIVNTRYNLLFESDCNDYKEYNKKYNNKMYPLVVVIEEYVALMDNKVTNTLLIKLLALARACNVKFILTIQRPCSKSLDSRIKANIPNIIAFKTQNNVNSRLILDHDKAAYLKGRGHGIVRHNNQELEFQGFFITDNQIKKLLKDKFIKKSNNITKKIDSKKNKIITLNPPKENDNSKTDTEKTGPGIVKDLDFLDKL
ncbi:FtsK/SpoIIIE domain-containing protein [Tepidibacter mesophilus]|uniref:FtsK/SpoIIIE domain-containing protein n=1 Tax=Tepidibacter mesophilus TaxID=655607 RepID=UPI001650E719|nr:FtsK/SpoIIIE domain-containing protein [Tepidibacter mesophilus]